MAYVRQSECRGMFERILGTWWHLWWSSMVFRGMSRGGDCVEVERAPIYTEPFTLGMLQKGNHSYLSAIYIFFRPGW